jgi:hypothetical protein
MAQFGKFDLTTETNLRNVLETLILDLERIEKAIEDFGTRLNTIESDLVWLNVDVRDLADRDD